MKRIYDKLITTIFSQSTPAQLFLVSILAFVFGFIPSFGHSPLLFLLVIFLVLILRVSIGLFVLIAIFAAVISYPLESLNFTLGTWLLDGFASSIFKSAINTPVLAYAGFEYYLVSGAFISALILGVIFGLVIAKLYKKTISKMANLQNENELYKKTTSKLSLKIVSKIIFGNDISKIDWQKIKTKKFRLPIRFWGVIVAIVLVILFSLSLKSIDTKLVSNIIKKQLSVINNAPVYYDSINLDLSKSKLTIKGLTATNPADPHHYRFYAKSIDANVNLKDLLTKHLVLNKVNITGASLNKATGGKTINSKTALQPAINDTQQVTNIAKQIKQVIAIILNFKNSQKNSIAKNGQTPQTKENAKVYNYSNIKAKNFSKKYPNLIVNNITIKDYQYKNVNYDIGITNLSTNSAEKPISIDIKSTNNDNFNVKTTISNQPNADNKVKFKLKKLNGNLLQEINFSGISIKANNFNISGNGTWQFMGTDNAKFNIPVKLTLNKITIKSANLNQKIDDIKLNATTSGDLNNTKFIIDYSSLTSLISSKAVTNTLDKLAKNAGISANTKQLLKNTKINGKSIDQLNLQDIQNLASNFGIKIN